MTNLPLTRGQLERKLSQTIQAIYRQNMGHQPSKITCELGDHNLTIILEKSITQPEQILAEQGHEDLAKEVRDNLGEAFKPELKKVIEETIDCEVSDILLDAAIDTGRTGIVAILKEMPDLRQPAYQIKDQNLNKVKSSA